MIAAVLGLILIGIVCLYMFIGRGSSVKGKLILGPAGLPVLGSVFEITDDNIHLKLYDYAKKFGKILRFNVIFDNIVVLNDLDLIKKAFTDERYQQYFNDRLDLFYGQYFRRGNQAIGFIIDGSSTFHDAACKQFREAMERFGCCAKSKDFEQKILVEMKHLVKRIETSPDMKFDCVDVFDRSVSNIMAILLNGKPFSDDDPERNLFWKAFRGANFFMSSHVNSVMTHFPFLRFLPGEYGRHFRQAENNYAKLAQRFFYDLKNTHLSKEVRGLVDYYLNVQKAQLAASSDIVFTDDRIIAQMFETVGAGLVLPCGVLTNAMLVLLNYPEYQSKIQKELDRVVGRDKPPTVSDREKCTLFKAFEMEMERYLTTMPFLIPHTCRKHVEFEGYDIAANSTVLGNIWYIHHNEEIWDHPWKFWPERFLDEKGRLLDEDNVLIKSLMPYGCGKRKCAAENIAREYYFLHLATLLQRWRFEFPPDCAVPCDPRLSQNFNMGLTLRAKPFKCVAKERT